MKKRNLYILLLVFSAAIFSCKKEYSVENGGNVNNPLIVGTNCRISQINYYDSASGVVLGSIAAIITAKDSVTSISKFDSLNNSIQFLGPVTYSADTTHINADEYYLINPSTGYISQLHGLTNPNDVFSPQFDAAYTYDATGHLINKSYSLTSNPGVPYYIVNYTYTGGNLTHMQSTDGGINQLIADADLDYYTNISPQHFLYLFPDELSYTYYNQFFNFGKKPVNAVKNLKIRYYDPGNVVRDSTVSTFSTYIMSRDNYVLSVYMNGDDQFSIPADAGKLTFSYHCK